MEKKNGRFWARVAVPKSLQAILGKSELIEPLGGDLRTANRKHAAAVARLQAQIQQARQSAEGGTEKAPTEANNRTMTPDDKVAAAWLHYTHLLQADEHKRDAMPTPAEIDAEYETAMQRIEAGEGDARRHGVAVLNLYTDYELKAGARHFDHQNRVRRLNALRSAASAGDFRLIDASVEKYIVEQMLDVEQDSVEWRGLASGIARAEIDALKRTLERDEGTFLDTPTDSILKPTTVPVQNPARVPLQQLFNDYIKKRQMTGRHRDGGANWEGVIRSLIKFLGHDDARKITKRDLIKWRDALLESGMSAKTVSDKYLAAINAVLKWAYVNDQLPTNEGELVRQEIPKKLHIREKGYTTAEAIEVLKASINHISPLVSAIRTASCLNSSVRFSPIVSLLCCNKCYQRSGIKPRQVQPASIEIQLLIFSDA
ncbi:hypothetical protein EOK75_15900 (plasmid) [Pseudorhodobacter turbinis]|uniref:Core-binding (CB) domain-containing protein n=1 Tax=Pseudorhodobacter turbinis TaxID=2500533 RepID=A0A4P8EJ88_9RHOB|nr:DUF6538 domain-containing protein [Pseudorhodobacter turbinis]QCO57241.1 hypothetical protein EOK75_15900 [Pseudorhodobacter turbinis]